MISKYIEDNVAKIVIVALIWFTGAGSYGAWWVRGVVGDIQAIKKSVEVNQLYLKDNNLTPREILLRDFKIERNREAIEEAIQSINNRLTKIQAEIKSLSEQQRTKI